MIRKRRKIRTKRGSRSCGGGNVKKRKGGGHRGGRGLAGGGKNKKTKADMVRQKYPNHFGKRGFKRPQAVTKKGKTINVQELDQRINTYIEQGIAHKKGDVITVHVGKIGVTKVLGAGKITRKLNVYAPQFSKVAVQKIEKAGGKINASS